MNVVLGGGISGLLIASHIPGSLVIESQNKVGGVFAFEEILGYKVPLYPPILSNQCHSDLFSFKDLDFNVVYEKEEYLREKLGVDKIPDWLIFKDSNKYYYVNNLYDIFDSLQKRVRIKFSSSFFIKNDKIVLASGEIIRPEIIYSTISRKMLGDNVKSISLVEGVFVVNKKKTNWDVIIIGDKGFSFSHVLKIGFISDEFDFIYVLAPFTKIPSWDKIYSDLKRKRVLEKSEIIAFRHRIISDGILIENEKLETSRGNIVFCGRLGKWRNFNLCQTVYDSLQC